MGQVQVTNTFNITTIIAVAGILLAFAAWLTPKLFDLARQILKELYDLKAWMVTYQRSLADEQKLHLVEITAAQTHQIEACIHQVPGHPEAAAPAPPAPAPAPGDYLPP